MRAFPGAWFACVEVVRDRIERRHSETAQHLARKGSILQARLTALARVVFIGLFLAVSLSLLPAGAFAQAGGGAYGPTQPAAASVPVGMEELSGTIDSNRSQLDQVLATLRRENLDDQTLQSLRDRIDPIQLSLQDVIAKLAPHVEAIKARIAQLGPKPDDKAPPEAASITADREAQQVILNGADDLLKRARLLAVQADQVSDAIVSRRRAAFMKDLLEQSRSIFSPDLWRGVAKDAQHEVIALTQLGGDFLSRASSNLQGWRAPLFFALLAGIIGLAVPTVRIGRRILSRTSPVEDPDPLRKVLGACWSMLVTSIVPVAIVLLLVVLGAAFDLFSDRVTPLVRALVNAVAGISIMAGLVRGVLAPERPKWRLLPLTDLQATRIGNLLFSLAVLVFVTRSIDVVHDIIVSSVATTVLTRGIGTLLVAIAIGATLYRLPAATADDDECLGPRTDGRRDWLGVLRFFGWLLALMILLSVCIGYVALGAFTADQIVWISMVSLAAFLILQLAADLIDAQFRPGSMSGRFLTTNVGLRRDRLGQIGILLSGALRLVIFATAALLIVAPWGIESNDFAGTLRAAYFGFAVGGVTLSPSSLVTAVVLFALTLAAGRAFQSWLQTRFLPTTTLDAGLRNSIDTVTGYIGFIVAAALALAQLGLSFDKLAIVAGALSVGIGFGLQSIVNNFVSGLILLWERAIRVGDWVVVGADQGLVRRINVRSTEIETFDRAMMIVPNSSLVTGTVKNWVRADRIGRIKIELKVQFGSDPEKVRDALIATAKENENVTRMPAPSVLFTDIAAGGLSFELVCFVNDVETAARTKSDLHFAIFRRFAEEEISIAPAPAGPTMFALAPETRDALVSSLRTGE